ncbi:MAG: TonB-dependent receptor [Novosphingobium sp.]
MPAPASAGDGRHEIVVTAAKREQVLQHVPASVSVTSGEEIERAHVLDLRELSSLVPSLRVSQLQSLGATNFFIRGFGNGANNLGIEPSVGLFIDGVYRSRSVAMVGDLPEVERIEVLRGPQSTLFGKNASAGVISVVTPAPGHRFGGHVEASYGDANAIVLKGAVTGPVAESVAVSLSSSLNRRDGYVRDLATGHRIDNRSRWLLRGQVLATPTDRLSIRLIGDYGRIDERCCTAANLRSSAATAGLTAIGGRVNPANLAFADVVYNNFDSTNAIRNWGGSGQVDYELGPLKLVSITAWRRTDAITNQDSDFTSADLLGRNFQDLSIRTFTQEVRLSASLPDRVNALVGAYYLSETIDQANQLQLGTQFRSYADTLIQAQTGGALSVTGLEQLFGSLVGNPALYAGRFFTTGAGLDEAYRLKDESWSVFGQMEIKLADRLTLTGGLSFTHDAKRFATNVSSNSVFSAIDVPAMVAASTSAGVAQQVGSILGVAGGMADAAQIASFASAQPATYQQIVGGVSAQTQPLLALRAVQFLPPFLNVPNAVEPGRVGGGDLSYTAALSYDVGERVTLYLRYATGFKAASVNLSRDSRPTAADLPAIKARGLGLVNLSTGGRFARPEEAVLFEGGAKGNWGVASANLTLFRQSIRDFQSNIFTGTGFLLANAGKQSALGIEFEGTARPLKALTLGLAVTWLDARYDEFAQSAFGDLSGTRPAGVSPLSATFSARYDAALERGARVILRGDYHYEAPFRLIEGLPGLVVRDSLTGRLIDASAAFAAAREFRQDVNEVNASVTLALANGSEFAVWMRNLLNDRTILQIFDSPAQAGSISGYPSQPRSYGVSARYSW